MFNQLDPTDTLQHHCNVDFLVVSNQTKTSKETDGCLKMLRMMDSLSSCDKHLYLTCYEALKEKLSLTEDSGCFAQLPRAKCSCFASSQQTVWNNLTELHMHKVMFVCFLSLKSRTIWPLLSSKSALSGSPLSSICFELL